MRASLTRSTRSWPLTVTPFLEFMQGDGYGWASLDVVDLDPPTTFPPR